jgi:superfamily I DNA/RNA helicase
MFENNEIVFLLGLNFLKKPYPNWLNEGIKLIGQSRNEKKALNQLCKLFTLYDLYLEYGVLFNEKFNRLCIKYKTTITNFANFYQEFEEDIKIFKSEFSADRMSDRIKMIRNNKKLHFYMNSGTVKISTVHSFKGWESETLFLIIERKYSGMSQSFDEILYTGLTRSRNNLVIINYGNEEYHEKLKTLINKVK